MDSDTPKPTLLVVEDEPAIKAIIGRLLGPNYHLFFACEVAEAREVMAESLIQGGTKIDGLLTDFNLPDGTGAQVVQAGRAAGITKIACMTGRPGNLGEIRALSPNCIIEKPFKSNADFREKITALFTS